MTYGLLVPLAFSSWENERIRLGTSLRGYDAMTAIDNVVDTSKYRRNIQAIIIQMISLFAYLHDYQAYLHIMMSKKIHF
jgi:hypothetical protein